jgi:hypothetical protein
LQQGGLLALNSWSQRVPTQFGETRSKRNFATYFIQPFVSKSALLSVPPLKEVFQNMGGRENHVVSVKISNVI